MKLHRSAGREDYYQSRRTVKQLLRPGVRGDPNMLCIQMFGVSGMLDSVRVRRVPDRDSPTEHSRADPQIHAAQTRSDLRPFVLCSQV